MLAQVLAQHRFIQRLTRGLCSRVGVRINQPRQQPASSHQLSAGDRIGAPPVTGSVQVGNIPAGQCDTPDSDDRHPDFPAIQYQ
jgi:DNA-binding Lrp family transcriptional regulator